MIAGGFLWWDAQSGPLEVIAAVVLISAGMWVVARLITAWIWGDWPFG